jgi:hypothetical protein
VIHALALIAAAVSTAALLVVVSVTVFVMSLAFRAKRAPESRGSTGHLEVSMVGEPQADPARFPEEAAEDKISAQPASTTGSRLRLSGGRSK